MASVAELHVNGARLRVDVDSERNLLSVLREDLDLTGAKPGCGEGQCGACTVLVDGEVTRSCITPVGATVGKRILTVEGLEQDARLHPLQQAFLDLDAMQCGYCTPGMIVAGVGLLLKNANPSDEEIIGFMQGNLCRCGTYPRIVRAIQSAAAALRAGAVSGGVR